MFVIIIYMLYILLLSVCLLTVNGLKTVRSRICMTDVSRVLPSVQVQENLQQRLGDKWSYGDLFELSSKHMVDAVSITSDGKMAVAIDNVDNVDISQKLHVVKIFPENIDSLLQRLIENHVNVDMIDVQKNGFFDLTSKIGDAFYNIVIYYFVITAAIAVLSRFVRLPGNGSNLLNPLNNNKNDVLDASNLNTTFADVAGCDEAKYELMEVVDFLKNKEKYEKAGAKIPKGVLLEGSPGTGKTLLARAVAGEAGVPFISASGSEFIELYVGIGASRVRSLFEKAKENSPCVIFIDEIDAVGRKRGAGIAGGNDEREQTLNQILTNMDGFTISDGIVVIAATNRIDVLDSALVRPGRFDRKVNVGLPDKEGRRKIFGVHLKGKTVGADFDLDEVVSLTTGFSGADIANLANEAAIYSVRSNSTAISQKNILDAYEKITIGLPSSTANADIDEKTLVSYHEMGHGFMVCIFKDMFDLRKITIKENKNGAGGYTLFTPKEKFQKYATKRFILANLIIAMGGRAAETYLYRKKKTGDGMRDKHIFNDFSDLDVTTGAVNDIKQANELARRYITEYGFGDNLCFIEDDRLSEMPFVLRDVNKNVDGFSNEKKCSIDNQIEYLVDFAYKKAYSLIEQNSEIFEECVDILINEKVITGSKINDYVDKIEKNIIDI